MSFEKDLNISYVDQSLPAPDKRLIKQHYFSSVIIYFSIYFILCYNPFFSKYFVSNIKTFYGFALMAYIIIAPVIFSIFKPMSIYASHSIEILNYIKRIFKSLFSKNTFITADYKTVLNSFIPSYKEKQSLMLMFIKVFFGTLMVNFLYVNIITISSRLEMAKYFFNFVFLDFNLKGAADVILINADFFYQLLVTFLFTIDVCIFSFGYLTEMAPLKNKIRTVETNIFGVLVCLICYPPFNKATHSFIGGEHLDKLPASGDHITTFIWILRFIAILFLCLYVFASIALGTKASNLTNRGTVSRFPYNIIRHPAYIAKNIFWLLTTTIPVLVIDFAAHTYSLKGYIIHAFLILFAYFSLLFVYYLRAITEERHLMQDPDYQEYAKKVKYRFIPFII